ncbi:MAG TPA: hypothetical protein VMP13_05565 [Acidimicrobiia bacterium]|nr:hypothetical protein [Acidimicrobiia bacterium]
MTQIAGVPDDNPAYLVASELATNVAITTQESINIEGIDQAIDRRSCHWSPSAR